MVADGAADPAEQPAGANGNAATATIEDPLRTRSTVLVRPPAQGLAHDGSNDRVRMARRGQQRRHLVSSVGLGEPEHREQGDGPFVEEFDEEGDRPISMVPKVAQRHDGHASLVTARIIRGDLEQVLGDGVVSDPGERGADRRPDTSSLGPGRLARPVLGDEGGEGAGPGPRERQRGDDVDLDVGVVDACEPVQQHGERPMVTNALPRQIAESFGSEARCLQVVGQGHDSLQVLSAPVSLQDRSPREV